MSQETKHIELHGQEKGIIPSEYFLPCVLFWQPQQHCHNQFSGIKSTTKVITQSTGNYKESVHMKTGETQVDTYRVQRCDEHQWLQHHAKCHIARTDDRLAWNLKHRKI